MATIDPLGTATTATQSTRSATALSGALGKDDFLKLLVGQMRHQDPLAPQGDGQQMLAQMAQFSSLEQISNLADATAKLAQASSLDSAVGLVGRTVAYTSGDATVEGVVERVSVAGGSPTLTIGGQAGIDPGAISQVR